MFQDIEIFHSSVHEGIPEDNKPFTNCRVLIFVLLLAVVDKICIIMISNGVCWFVDELLYPAHHKMDIKEPVFFTTAPHSGSTQLAHYLEDDKNNFISLTSTEILFSYILYWKLVISTSARIVV